MLWTEEISFKALPDQIGRLSIGSFAGETAWTGKRPFFELDCII